MDLLGAISGAPVLVQQAEQRVEHARAQLGARRDALLPYVLAGGLVASACQAYTTIITAAMCTQNLSEGDAMRLLAASSSALQAAPAALDVLRHLAARGMHASESTWGLLMESSAALVKLFKWLALHCAPPRVHQLAERRTLAAPVLLAWLRSMAPAVELLCRPGVGKVASESICYAVCRAVCLPARVLCPSDPWIAAHFRIAVLLRFPVLFH
jgi:hypothetical protein